LDYKQYQPTDKLLYHLEHLQKIRDGISVGPIHISVWPTNKCQFSCSYCCCKKVIRDGTELNINSYKKMIDIFYKYGLKAVELSGGGEPLLWSKFDEAVEYSYDKGLKLSLITNGVALKNSSKDTLKKFDWIRISIQSLNHLKMISFDNIPVKNSISYIVSNETSLINIEKIWTYLHNYDIIGRVAVAHPCSIEWEEKVKLEVEKYGFPLFFSVKERGQAKGCYMPYIRGAIDWMGNFLPCPSTQLNQENEGFISNNFILCNIDNLEEWILNNPPHDLGYKCLFCNCGKIQNDYIFDLLHQTEDIDFV
jgi:organic radical activating enzyme